MLFFETDFLKSLEDNSTVDERKAMMKDLAQHTFANDNYIPAMNAKKLRISTKNLSEQTPETNKTADPLSVIYYQVNENAGNSTKLSFNTASDEMIAVVIAKLKDGSSCVIAKTSSPDEVVSLTAMDDLDHYFVAVCNCSFTASNSYSISVGEYIVEQSADVLRFEKTVLVDNEDITITALGGIAEGRWININCEYQSKSSKTLYLRYDDSILNGYTLETIFDDADYYGFAVEPKSNGKLLLRVAGSSVMRSSESYDALEVTIKDEYCIENGFDLTPCFKIAHVYGEVSENDYTIKGNTIQIDGGASDIPDSIIELYTQMSVEELAKRKLNKILYYQPMNASDGNFAVNAVAVAEYQDGTHFIMFETENLSDKDMGWLDNFIGISAVNGIAIDHIISTDCVMKPHTKRLCYIDTYPLSNEKRMAMYGLSSIGSYDIYVCMDKNDLLEDYTVSFGEENSCNVGRLLYEDDYGCYYYVGAGPTVVGDCILDDVLLIIKKELKDDRFDFSNIKEVYADGELKDKIIIGEDCIRNGAFYEIELSNVDPTEDHELKIVTKNGYSVVVDEIVIPYKGQPENK